VVQRLPSKHEALSSNPNAEKINLCRKNRSNMYVKGKMRPVETIPGVAECGIKENDRGVESNYDIF
jgi:hypothetical protein